jgi:hypothetical protein
VAKKKMVHVIVDNYAALRADTVQVPQSVSKASAELTQPASAVIDNGAIALVVLVQRNARALSRSHFDL